MLHPVIDGNKYRGPQLHKVEKMKDLKTVLNQIPSIRALETLWKNQWGGDEGHQGNKAF